MSNRPPFPSREDLRHLRVADTEHAREENAGHEDGVQFADDRPREIKLRLRPASGLPAVALTDRHIVLAALLNNVAGATRLLITYALRRDMPLEVAVALDVHSNRKGAQWRSTEAINKRSLEALCRVAFPGMAAVEPSMPLFEGPSISPQAPYLEALETATRRCSGLPLRSVTIFTPNALLPLQAGAPVLALDKALKGLAEAGINVDLSIGIAPFVLQASHLRALADVQQRLVAATYTEDWSTRTRFALEEVEAWLQTRKPALRVEALLRFHAAPQTAAVRLVEGLLFGPGVNAAPTQPDLDLSSLVRHGAPIPNFVVHPLAVAAISEARRRRRPRLPWGDIVRLGTDEFGRKVAISVEDLRQHLYIVGQTGVGKSTMLKTVALADAKAGRPFIMVDPHGDLHAEVLDALPRSIRSRTILADAGDFDSPFSLNILEVSGPYAAIQRNFIANQMIGLFKSVYGYNPNAFGPMFEAYFRGALFLLMDAGGHDASLLDLERVFGDGPYRRGLLEKCTDPSVTSFWRNIAQKAGGEASLENIAPYITSKLSQLAGNPLLRPILCTPRTSLDIPLALSEGRTVLVNLAKGVTGSDAGILGGIITIRLFAAGMTRARLPIAERRSTRVILDEFQTYGTVSILAEALAEVRKYGLSIVLAKQSIAQVDGRAGDIAHAILGNTGNLAVFRVGPKDAALLAEWLGPEVSPASILRLPNHTSIARLLRAGEPSPPVPFRTDVRRE